LEEFPPSLFSLFLLFLLTHNLSIFPSEVSSQLQDFLLSEHFIFSST
jgi:hypothetical protein